MTRTQRSLDLLFWLGTLAVLAFALLGCEAFQRATDALVTPSDALGGQTPAAAAGAGLLGVIANPASWPAWAQIVGAVGTVAAAAWGGPKVTKKAKSLLGK